MKDWILQIIERLSGKLHNWAWDKRWKERDPKEWVGEYRKWKNEEK